MFTWIPIHEEAAKRLLDFKDRQTDLIDILARMHAAGLVAIPIMDRGADGSGFQLKEINPFLFLANFNRGIRLDNRQALWSFLKEEWNLKSPVPDDYDGLPVANKMNSWFMPYAATRIREHVPLLWEFFEHMMDIKTDGLDRDLMQKSIDLFKIKLPMLSMGMFWACPRKWIATDGKNLEYAASKGVSIKPVTAADYLNWLPKIREAIGGDGVEFSRQAHLWAISEKSGGKSGICKAGKSLWWQRYFETEKQTHAAFDLIRDACIALGVSDSKGGTAQRVSFTNIKGKGSEWLRLNCSNILVLQIGAVESGMPNASFIMRADEQQGEFVPQELFAKPCNGHEMGFCNANLADLIEKDSIARDMFFRALGDVTATYKNIINRNFENAHRPMLLSAAFHPKSRGYIFAYGPKRPPAEEKGFSDPSPTSASYTKIDALMDLFMPEENVNRAIALLKRKKNVILQGAPGTGKTFLARRLAYLLMGEADPCRAPMVQFHQSTAYEDFIQGYRPDGNGGFELKNGIFHEFCRRAAEDQQGRPFVFIIDEINRGNLSKIFGEIMMLIESDKRGTPYAVPLAYASSQDETFHIPENVFVIGTMNTADRSLSLVDYALRRRFAFLDVAPGFASPVFESHMLDRGVKPKLLAAIRERMTAINDMIEGDTHNLGKGYRIGHSFFVPGADVSPDFGWYAEVVHHEILPLLGEYWVDDEKSLKAAEQNLMAGIPE
jgi:5-methylcytosine-specific restriction enzyme B